jgi:hypothetical protein
MRWLPLVAATALAACLGPAPPPPPMPAELSGGPDCASTAFAADPAFGPASVERFIGIYRMGRESVTVSRQDHRFLAHRVRFGVRELRADAPGAATFRDGCGVRYAFSPAWLVITDVGGAVSRWRRQGY